MKGQSIITTVSENGSIEIPRMEKLKGKQVEVIVRAFRPSQKKKQTARDFVKKWRGFLSGDTNDQKLKYLIEKHS